MRILNLYAGLGGNRKKWNNCEEVSLLAFGTTINNHSMHYSWVVVPVNKLSDELIKFLKSEGLL